VIDQPRTVGGKNADVVARLRRHGNSARALGEAQFVNQIGAPLGRDLPPRNRRPKPKSDNCV